MIIQKLKIEKIPFLKKCSTYATIFQFGLKGTKMLRMSSEVVLAQLIFVWQQGMARVHLIAPYRHIFCKSVSVEKNLMTTFLVFFCFPEGCELTVSKN